MIEMYNPHIEGCCGCEYFIRPEKVRPPDGWARCCKDQKKRQFKVCSTGETPKWCPLTKEK